jgi:hypothetical protein
MAVRTQSSEVYKLINKQVKSRINPGNISYHAVQDIVFPYAM